MKKEKIISVILTVGLAVGLLGGCGSSSGKGDIPEQGSAAESVQTEASAEKTQNSNSGERKKLVLWTWAPGQFNKVQEAFLASHPDADWQFEEVVVSVEDYLTKLQQGYASGGDMPESLREEMGWRGSEFDLDIWEKLEEEN